MKEVVILRSVSGAGKSTVADLFCENRPGWVVCCADDFFMNDGKYDFKPELLRQAHEACFEKFRSALNDYYIRGIVIANTNTREREFKPYVEEAVKYGARVHFNVIENRHGGIDTHGVPDETKLRQEASIKQSLKLR